MQTIKNLSFENVTFDGGFWKQRYDLNRLQSLQSVYKRFEESGRFDALRFNYKEGKSYPHIFYDSDVAKWIEAVGYLIIKNGGYDKEQKVIDDLVDDMAKNQLENGYLNSHFIQIEPQNIFKRRGDHELYCAGHLIEAAITYDKATGKGKFFDVMLKYVDCIERAFLTEKTASFRTCGHEEIELALLRLYDYTCNKKYLDLALFFINERGKTGENGMNKEDTVAIFNSVYDQSNVPVRELKSAEGHAVRATYLYVAMCEAYLKTGDESLKRACLRLFDDITTKKMYVTGGIGSSSAGEAFTVPFDLPNLEAYTESCAALGLQLFALSLQKTAIDHRFGDVIERIMYNNMLSSTSLDGKAFFYENPLEIDLNEVGKDNYLDEKNQKHYPLRHRVEVFDCSCCPPNLNRLFARVGDFFFSETKDVLVVNQYACLTLKCDRATIKEETDYPYSGVVKFKVEKCDYQKILLRIPEWCDDFTLVGADFKTIDGYIEIKGFSDEFTVDFGMKPYFVEANPRVRADCGKVALLYGPTVYCIEGLDNDYELNALSVSIGGKIEKAFSPGYAAPDFFAEGYCYLPFDGLYRKAKRLKKPVTIRLRPYWTFANREECDMLVWIAAADK